MFNISPSEVTEQLVAAVERNLTLANVRLR